VTWSATTRDLAECWQGGRWAIGGVSITWIQSQAYAYAAIGILGSAGLGRANAARLLVAPFLLLVPALNQVTMPRLAEIRARDPGAMIRKGRALTTVLVCLALAYSGVLVALAGSIAPAVLGPRYTGMRPLVAAWCVVLVASVLRDGAGTILQVRKEFRSLTLLNGISAAIATAAAVALIATCSVPGAVLGTAAGELALGALLWRKIRHANG
jgi:O-antigen/teichoic acid export membrane protein